MPLLLNVNKTKPSLTVESKSNLNSLGHDDQQSGQVLRVQNEVLLLDDISQAAGHQTATVIGMRY